MTQVKLCTIKFVLAMNGSPNQSKVTLQQAQI